MSLREPGCLVCGSPIDEGEAITGKTARSEVCSDECCAIYTEPDDTKREEMITDKFG